MQSATSPDLIRAGFILGLFLTSQAIAGEPTLEYLYIDSNVGDSSGGHSALRTGDYIFHYQYFPDRIFRLVRDDAESFFRAYNQTENRTVHISKLDVADADVEKIQDHLTRLLLIQDKHAHIQAEFRGDLELARSSGQDWLLAIDGFGFFETDCAESAVREQIASKEEGLAGLTFDLGEVKEISLQPLASPDVKVDEYPILSPSYSSKYKDVLQRRLARKILSKNVCLAPRAHFETGLQLSQAETENLERYLAILNRRIPELLEGRLSGRAALLAIARRAAIEKSLSLRSWVVLDIFTPEQPGIRIDASDPFLMRLNMQADNVLSKARENFSRPFDHESDPEIAYNLIENAAGRLREIQGKGRTPGMVRFSNERLLPRGSAKTRISDPNIPANFISLTKVNAARHLDAMHEVFGYNLITRNCTTEILRQLQASFPNSTESIRALGGSVNPDGIVTFIPFVSSYQVEQNLRIAKSEDVLSRRRRALAKLYKRESPFFAYLRESNTVSSVLYRPRSRDTYFLMFTDDVMLPRPLYGLLNFTYALGHTVLGIGYLPLGTEHLEGGARGVLFSLPELMFFNIRKGTFDDVEDQQPGE
ncbi:MAG: hypothetical protein K8S54_11430 [Spirochaetia bacterium]|nr:hypothetical protein [Spirochaetia bacterium]